MKKNIKTMVVPAALMMAPILVNAQQYSLKKIPIPTGFSGLFLGTAINASGEVAGSAYREPYYINPHVFVYSKGVTTDLGDDDPLVTCDTNSSGATAAGINESGQIAATICATTEFPSAALLADGVYKPFAGSGRYNVLPFAWSTAINAGGWVVGTLETGGTCVGNDYHTILYNPGTGVTQDLGTMAGCSSQGLAINDAGQIAGYFSDTGGNSHAYLYSNGTAVDLGNLGYQYAQANGINAGGQVTGYSYRGLGTAPDAFLWSDGVMGDIGNLGGSSGSTGNAINVAGQVVGTSWTTGNAAQHAFMYIAGTMVDLNMQIPDVMAAKYTLVNAVAINDNGQIVVQGYVNSDTTQNTVTFLLTPLTPAVTPLVAGTLGTNGWYVGATTLSWYVTGTPAPTNSGCDKVTVPNTTGTTYTCTATNAAGSATKSVTIKRDTVAPAVSVKAPANNAIYTIGQKVPASYGCTDTTSGVASCAGTVTAGTAIATSVAGLQSFSVTGTDNAGNAATKTVSYIVEPPTATPVLSLKSGTYTGAQSVTISDATVGAIIYYTLDGTTPTTSSSMYAGTAISIGSTETLKADAIAPGFTRSPVRSASYAIQ
jgi:probable HAF family extracellular repeat protein